MPALPHRDSMKSNAAWPSTSTESLAGAVREKGRDARDGVGAHRFAKDDQVAGIPGIPLVFGKPLADPGRRAVAGKNVESEDVSDFVREEPEPLIGGDVDAEQDAIVHPPAAGGHSLRPICWLRWRSAAGLEEDERHLEAEVVAKISADAFVGALRLCRDAVGVQIE